MSNIEELNNNHCHEVEDLPLKAEVLPMAELTPQERAQRLELEQVVKESFIQAGRALRKLRDNRLYRSTYQTFEAYCHDVFGFNRRHPYQLIEAAKVFEHLEQSFWQQMCADSALNSNFTTDRNCKPILPTAEFQLRPLTVLSPEEQILVWQRAVIEAGGKVPSNRIVKQVVEQIKQSQISNCTPKHWRVDDIVQIKAKDNAELRGRNNQWAIIDEVLELSCLVRVWDGRLQVNRENLKAWYLSAEERKSVKDIWDRCHRLMQVKELDRGAKVLLESFSKITSLTAVEKSLLQNIEDYYFDDRGNN